MPPSLASFPSIHHPMRCLQSRPVPQQELASRIRNDESTNSTCIVTSDKLETDDGPRPVTVRVVLQGVNSGVNATMQRASFHNGKSTISVHVDPTESVEGRKLHVVTTQATVRGASDKESPVFSTHLIDVYTSRFHGESAVTTTLVLPSGGKHCASMGALDVDLVLAWC